MDLTKAIWLKSTYSGAGGGNCIEVAGNLPGITAVRDSKDRNGAALAFGAGAWAAFLRSIKADHYNLA
jgi:hypothetical protein